MSVWRKNLPRRRGLETWQLCRLSLRQRESRMFKRRLQRFVIIQEFPPWYFSQSKAFGGESCTVVQYSKQNEFWLFSNWAEINCDDVECPEIQCATQQYIPLGQCCPICTGTSRKNNMIHDTGVRMWVRLIVNMLLLLFFHRGRCQRRSYSQSSSGTKSKSFFLFFLQQRDSIFLWMCWFRASLDHQEFVG